MPKLNRIRLGNIVYNNHKNIIGDETINLHEESSLLRMENGGGKSVMTQLLLAPYISGRLRNFPNRKFADYFQDRKPSILMQEWKLDDEAGYFLVGMVLRKKTSIRKDESEQEENSRLDFYTFIAEYESPADPLVLDHYPILIHENNRPGYISFQDFKVYLDNLGKSYPQSFRLFNMNTSGMPTRFASKLAELGIEQIEWDQMRAFNQDESGLSTLADTNNTELKLLSNTLLPAIGRKLDAQSGADHLETFRAAIRSYTEMMLKNANIYEKKAQREAFLEMLLELEPIARSLEEADRQRLNELGKLNSFSNSLFNADILIASNIEQENSLVTSGQQEKIAIQCEIYSQNYYKTEEELETLKDIMDDLQNLIDEKNYELALAEEKLHLHKLALYWEKTEEEKSEIAALNTRIESAKKSAGELQEELSQVGFSLNRLLTQRILETENLKTKIEKEIANLRQEKTQAQQELAAGNKNISELDIRMGGLNQILKSYEKQEKEFCSQQQYSIAHSLTFYEDEAVLENVVKEFETAKENAIKKQEEISHQIKIEEEQQEKQQSRLTTCKVSAAELKGSLNEKKKLVEKNESLLSRKREIAHDLMFKETEIEDQIFQDEKLKAQLERREKELDYSISDEHEQISFLKRQIENLETGCDLDVPEPVADVLSEMGLSLLKGSEMLKASRMSVANKLKVLANHPFIPYSLVLPQNRIGEFVKELEERNIYTSSILPIVARESLNVKKGQDVSDQDGSVRFYLHYNSSLIEEEKLNALLEQERRKLVREEESLETLNLQKQQAVEQKKWIEEHPLTLSDFNRSLKERDDLLEKVQTNLDEQNQLQAELTRLKNELNLLKKELKAAEKVVEKAKKAYGDAASLHQLFQQAAVSWYELEQLQNQKEGLLKKRNQLNVQIGRFDEQIEAENKDISLQKNNLDNLKKELDKYKNYQSEIVIAQSQPVLEARFKALFAKLENTELSDLNNRLTKAQNRLQSSEKLLKKQMSKGMPKDDSWKSIKVSEEEIEDQNDGIKKIETAIRSLENEQNDHKISKNTLQIDMENFLNRIEELSGKREPKAKKETRSMNLQPELDRIDLLIKEAEEAAKNLKERKVAFSTLKSRTDVQLRESGETEFVEMPLYELAELSEQEAADKFENLKVGFEQSLSAKKRHSKLLSDRLTKEKAKLNDKEDEDLAGALNALLELVSQPSMFASQLEMKSELLKTLLDKIDNDLKNVEQARTEAEAMLYDYVRKVHQQLNLIDRDTTIQLRNRSRKMLNITQPDWNEHEALYKDRVHEFLTDIIVQATKRPETIDEILARQIQLNTLYNAVVNLSRISISLYKIEENGETRIAWHDAGKTSGAEGFLCAFTVVAAVLAYQRRDETGMISGSKKSSVMLMDNPFAKAHSPHIIKALMQMCKVMHIQFVAFSAVENSAILNAFNTIYSLRLVPRNDGRNHLLVESLHKKEDEVRNLETIEIHVDEID